MADTESQSPYATAAPSPREPIPELDLGTNEPSLKVANPPFDDADPTTDIVLRTSDSVDFWVHKIILSLTSPFFRDMLTLPQPKQSGTSSTELVHVTENAYNLDLALRFCYPIEDPLITNLEDLVSVLEITHKYQMNQEKALRRLLVSPPFIDNQPLRVFAIASRYHLTEEAHIAARKTLSFPLLSPPVDELHHITGYELQKLINYRERCGIVAQKTLLDFSWWNSQAIWFQCSNASCLWSEVGGYKTQERLSDRNCGVKAWFTKFLVGTGFTLRRDPSAVSVAHPGPVEKAVPSACPYCRVAAPPQWVLFVQNQLAPKLDRVLAEVPFEM